METQPISDEPHVAFLKSHREPVDPFLKTCPDVDMFKRAIEIGVMEKVADWRKFVKGFGSLKKNVFHKELYGESFENVVETRFSLAKRCFPDQNDMQKQMQFATWVFFETRMCYVYAPQHIVRMFCAKNGLDLEDFMEVLVRHPDYKNLQTSRDIRAAELGIERWLQAAQPVPINPQDSEELDAEQNASMRLLLASPFSVLQGNAGCGKTTTVCEMIKQLSLVPNVMVVAAAYTHKAKKCIEVRLRKAGLDNLVMVGTVHSIIGVFKAMEQSKHVFLILDEASMLDIDLLGDLASSMTFRPLSYQLCFVGDYFQIQPVGRGEFFRQLVEDNKVVHTLQKCYRTDHPDLFKAYELVRKGQLPASSENFSVHLVETDKEVSSFVGKFIMKHLDTYQIICWQNKHIWMINQWVQKALLTHGKIGPGSYKGFYENDKVVYSGENDENVTNSMLGVVVKATSSGMMVCWENKDKHSFYKDTKGVSLSYAISAHKSQGSEYKHVCVVCYEVEKMNKCLDKRWFYTSITRGQKDVVLVSTPDIKGFVEKPLSKIPIHNIKVKYA